VKVAEYLTEMCFLNDYVYCHLLENLNQSCLYCNFHKYDKCFWYCVDHENFIWSKPQPWKSSY